MHRSGQMNKTEQKRLLLCTYKNNNKYTTKYFSLTFKMKQVLSGILSCVFSLNELKLTELFWVHRVETRAQPLLFFAQNLQY